MSTATKNPFMAVPLKYLCKACGMAGDHWIMACKQQNSKRNINQHMPRKFIDNSNESNPRSIATLNHIYNLNSKQLLYLRIKKKQLLVFGYIRLNSQRTNIPNTITDICNSFVGCLIDELINGLYSNYPGIQFICTQKIRKLLSIERKPPIEEVIDSGVAVRLVEFLSDYKYSKLHLDAAWAITNIVSGTSQNVKYIISIGAIPIFIKLLKSSNITVVEQAAWALGNIAGDSPDTRNIVLEQGVLENLIPLFNANSKKLSLLRNVTWTLSNFSRGHPAPKWDFLQLILSQLCTLLKCDDRLILIDVCWSYNYVLDFRSRNDKDIEIEMILKHISNSGALARLVDLLTHSSRQICHPALRSIGNLLTHDDFDQQILIQLGLVKQLSVLLDSDSIAIKREACWAVSNIAAGTKQDIEYIICGNLIPKLISFLTNSSVEIQMEALWAIGNAICGGSHQQIRFFVYQGVIMPLCEFLKQSTNDHNDSMLIISLEAIENILMIGKGDVEASDERNRFADYVEEAGGIGSMEVLISNHRICGTVIYDKISLLLSTYWNRTSFCKICADHVIFGYVREESMKITLATHIVDDIVKIILSFYC